MWRYQWVSPPVNLHRPYQGEKQVLRIANVLGSDKASKRRANVNRRTAAKKKNSQKVKRGDRMAAIPSRGFTGSIGFRSSFAVQTGRPVRRCLHDRRREYP